MAALRRGAVRAVLRHGRCHAAVRHAGRRIRRAHRRLGAHPRALAGDRERRWPGSTVPATWTATASSSTRAARKTGLSNQGWKDSHDSVFHADGRLAEGPIALVEVQGYAYAARLAASACARALGLEDRAAALAAQAEQPAPARSRRPSGATTSGFYALALDGKKAPCRVRTSNPGHALCHRHRRARPRRRRRRDAAATAISISGWGIRTVAKGEARYNPMSYHNGSIWPHDNAMLAQRPGPVRRQARRRSTSSRR